MEEDEINEQEKSEVDNVREAREKLKAENDAFEAEKLRAEKLRAEQQLGGKSFAGRQEPVISEEDKKKERASEFFKGTALGDAINKTNG